MLFTLIAALFGPPLDNWLRVTETELAILLTGVVMIGIYLRNVKREHLISAPVGASRAPSPSSPSIS